MSRTTVGIVGTGPDPDDPVWGESAAMAYRHADAYRDDPRTRIVGCADLVRENALEFADEFDLAEGAVFEDYRTMLREVEPDVVSICTPVPTHAELVVGAAETGVPRAIHCEKPMAHTWGDSKRMAAVTDERGVQLTFNHQRRFSPVWQEASRLLNEGAIGDLQRVEMGGANLFDYGTHLVDLCNRFAGERRAEWVLGQVHYDDANVRYGVHNENQGLATWSYGDGVHGLASTGFGSGANAIGCDHRLLGSEGVLEVKPADSDADLRYRTDATDGWVTREFEGVATIPRAIEHVIECLDTGDHPVVSADHALRATEIIFAAWESARRRARVDLPLEADGNALTELVDDGRLRPASDE